MTKDDDDNQIRTRRGATIKFDLELEYLAYKKRYLPTHAHTHEVAGRTKTQPHHRIGWVPRWMGMTL